MKDLNKHLSTNNTDAEHTRYIPLGLSLERSKAGIFHRVLSRQSTLDAFEPLRLMESLMYCNFTAECATERMLKKSINI